MYPVVRIFRFCIKEKNRKRRASVQIYSSIQKNIYPDERPFIIILSRFYRQLAEHIYIKLLCFEFSKKEIQEACLAL